MKISGNRFLRALSIGGLILGLTVSDRVGAQPVVVAQAKVVSFPVVLEAVGTARANEAVEIRPLISERLTAIHFQEGEHVERNALLVELDATQARASVASARAALVESEAQLARAERLREAQSLAQAEYDTRLARRDSDRAALSAVESALSKTEIRAPFGGRVGLRRVSIGSLLSPETVITTLDDTDPIKVDFDVPETALAHLAPGHRISTRSVAWPEASFVGKVASVDTRVDPVSRSVTARGVLANPESRLRPGMFLTVVLLREDVQALVVPEQAIVPEQSRQFVFVVGDDDRVEKREVRIGRRRSSLVEVHSGLNPGDRVIAEGTQRARPGSLVQVVDEISVADDGSSP
ncbi:MAG: efflux RND transporter periplasmic adaptor subunit [Myxococcales bacterium]|nr:efflux RND transporter periplasmic adaptor subunit [Myxococcales bacterium]